MSAFAMAWDRAGGPVAPGVRDAISRRLEGSGRRRVRERSGPAWAAWIAQDDWAPGAEDALPLDLGGWRGTGALRLDDRPALAARVRDRAGPGAEDDASLAWRAFAAWGDEAPSRWIGDYALAVLAPEGDRLIATRGTLGILHCFYAVAGPLVLVADDPRWLLGIDGIDLTLDEQAVAEYLGTGELVTPTLSFRRGIRRVPAAHSVRFDRDGAIRTWRQWELPTPTSASTVPEREVVDGFREVVGRAVGDRLRGRGATILLSGGLDSPLLAATARAVRPGAELSAITVSWRRLLPADDEAEWAARAASRLAIPHEVVEMDPAEGFVDEPAFWTPEPTSDLDARLWRAFSRRLAAKAPVAFLGDDLDTLLSPSTLLDQLRTDGIVATLRRWSAYRRSTGRRPWIGLRRSFGSIERLRDRRWRRPPGWLRPGLVSRHPLPDVPAARPHPTRPLVARALAQPLWESTLWDDAPQTSGASVQLLLPFMDPRVITYCLSVASVPWCQEKYLVRAALRGAVPDALVERPKQPLDSYFEARVRTWRAFGARRPLPAAVDAWVDLRRWEQAMSETASAEEVLAAWRVLELSRWLGQPASEEG
jgi:hypothetical protein